MAVYAVYQGSSPRYLSAPGHCYDFEIPLFLSLASISIMKKIITLLSFLVWMTFLIGCKKDKDKIKISGFQITDAFGNQMTTIGYVDDDWKLNDWSSLSPFEKSLFDFPDTVSLNGTLTGTVQIFPAYPNPSSSYSSLSFSSSDTVKMKIVLVDANGQRFRSTALKFKGGKAVSFDISERDLFPSGKSLRYYYSFSSATQQNFKVGYGDIKICNLPNYMECF